MNRADEIVPGVAATPNTSNTVPATDRPRFWMDTCREVTRMQSPSPRVIDLYRQYGCRFWEPSFQQAQDLVQALDGAVPRWDQEHPELFYQALELNYPELVRH